MLNGRPATVVSYGSVPLGAGWPAGRAAFDGAESRPPPRAIPLRMSDSTFELETLLREKEELVEALTERLEQAAEQLDRLQRANGDRGRWMTGGVPAELVEQQRTVCEDLERVVQQWEDSQPTAALSRIEMQIQELRDLVVRMPAGGGLPAEERPHEAAAQDSGADAGMSAWEALKAGLLGQSPPADGTNGNPAREGQGSVADGPDPFDGEPLEPPAPVDFEFADSDELRRAVIVRDDFIAELLRRLRSAESRTRSTDDWKSLETVPEDLRNRLESLERRLEQTLRLTEVELSLERARLGREEVRLKQLEEAMQKAARRGMASDDDEEDDEERTASDGRWKRMLGIKRER